MKITKEQLSEFRVDLEDFLKSKGKDYGVMFKVGAMTYSDTTFVFKTEATLGESKEEVQRSEFYKLCEAFGYSKDDYLKEVTHKGRVYNLIGFKRRAKVNPLIIQDKANGKKYVASLKFAR